MRIKSEGELCIFIHSPRGNGNPYLQLKISRNITVSPRLYTKGDSRVSGTGW